MFSRPRQGIHSLRDPIFDLALVDVLGTLGVAYMTSRYFGYSLMWTLIGLLVAGTIVHMQLGIQTQLILNITKR